MGILQLGFIFILVETNNYTIKVSPTVLYLYCICCWCVIFYLVCFYR